MGAFLAALGAVLLFVLKAVGILLLVLLALVVLLLLCPFCADLCWEHGVLTVRAGALGITFPVFQYPKPEPPPAPENPEPPKGFGKVKAKFAAWRAERKRKKAEEKARKKAAAAAGKPARPRKKAKITLEGPCALQKYRCALACAGRTLLQRPAITASCRRGCIRCWASWIGSSGCNLTSCASCQTSAAVSPR